MEENKYVTGLKKLVKKLARGGFLYAAVPVLFLFAVFSIPQVVSVSSSVNGRELPIYSVETEEKKVALSFDAAWAEGCLMEQKNTNKILQKGMFEHPLPILLPS